MAAAFDFLLVAFGGAAGGIARFWLSAAVARRTGERFPWGTLSVNASGALALGALGAVLGAPELSLAARRTWLLLAAGVLGSYTTVSSFSFQTLELARGGEPLRALLNVAFTFGLCLGAAACGYWGGRLLMGG